MKEKKAFFRQIFPAIFFLGLAGCTVLLFSIGHAHADLTEQAKLIPGDGSYNDQFGKAVCISGDYAIVGAPYDDEGVISNSGCAYIFRRNLVDNTWTEVAKLMAPDRSHDDIFGFSVSIDGDYAIVGKPFDDHTGTDYGSAYVFHRIGDSWEQEAKLVAEDGGTSDYFGNSVAIGGNYAIIGAPFDDDKGDDSGSAYIFERSGSAWSQVAKLLAGDGSAGDNFGSSVSISGDDALVGAPRYVYEGDSDAGAMYAFKGSGSTWIENGPLINPGGAAGDQFGWSVAVNGNFALGGAHSYDEGTGLANCGAARLFEEVTDTGIWGTITGNWLASDAEASDQFGESVSISDDYAVVGSLKYFNNAGTAYVFYAEDHDNWLEFEKLVASDGSKWGFGSAVSLSGRYAIVGAWGDLNQAGSAYVYDILAEPNPTVSGALPSISILLLSD